MADDAVSYYPPDLPLEIANVVTSAHTLDCSRLVGKRPKIVHREHLTTDGLPTPHGKRCDATDEQIAASLWSALEADAAKHCKGYARYKVTAHYSKPARGTGAESQSFDLEVGDPPIADHETKQRDGIIAELHSLLGARHKEYLELARETTNLCKAVGTMATGLAAAWSSVHESRAKVGEHALELKILENERDGERERMQIFSKTVVPMLNMLRGGKALPDDGSGKPEIVQVARKLGRSFTEQQLEAAARIMGSERLRELRDVDEAAQVMAIGAWLIGHARTEDLYGELREDQAPLVERLQLLLAKGGEEQQQTKALAGAVG